MTVLIGMDSEQISSFRVIIAIPFVIQPAKRISNSFSVTMSFIHWERSANSYDPSLRFQCQYHLRGRAYHLRWSPYLRNGHWTVEQRLSTVLSYENFTNSRISGVISFWVLGRVTLWSLETFSIPAAHAAQSPRSSMKRNRPSLLCYWSVSARYLYQWSLSVLQSTPEERHPILPLGPYPEWQLVLLKFRLVRWICIDRGNSSHSRKSQIYENARSGL
jgi:hypothetical protein